eukprot:2086642-Rhodomonas_salina.2
MGAEGEVSRRWRTSRIPHRPKFSPAKYLTAQQELLLKCKEDRGSGKSGTQAGHAGYCNTSAHRFSTGRHRDIQMKFDGTKRIVPLSSCSTVQEYSKLIGT